MSINANNAALNEILEAINELPEAGSGKTEIETTIDITENGETVVTPDDENTTLSKVIVSVDVPVKEEQEKVVDITENGTTEVTPDEGMALSKVIVNVEVESSGGEDVRGLIFSDFINDYQPQVADARSFPLSPNKSDQSSTLNFSFSNTGAYRYLRDIYLPNNIYIIPTYFCRNGQTIENVYGDLSKVEAIGAEAFYMCKSLTEVPYMPNLTKLDKRVFYGCASLTEFKFYTKATEIGSDAFIYSEIKDIYVPWAEGEVANAPWGATNATIHYNTTYDENGNPIVTEE